MQKRLVYRKEPVANDILNYCSEQRASGQEADFRVRGQAVDNWVAVKHASTRRLNIEMEIKHPTCLTLFNFHHFTPNKSSLSH